MDQFQNQTADDIVALKNGIYRGYIAHARDARLGMLLRELVTNVEACRLGGGSRRRAVPHRRFR